MSLLKPFHLEEFIIEIISGGNVMRNQHNAMEKKQNKGGGRKSSILVLLSLKMFKNLGQVTALI